MTLSPELEAMNTVERRLALFALSMVECALQSYDLTHSDIQEEAVRLGLLVRHNKNEPFTVAADVRGVLDGITQAHSTATSTDTVKT